MRNKWPDAFKKKQGWKSKKCPYLKVIPLPFLLILKEETIPGLNSKERLDQRVEEKDDVIIAIKYVIIHKSALIKGTLTRTMIKILLKAIKGMTGRKEEVKEAQEIKEEDNHSRRQEIPGMNLTP